MFYNYFILFLGGHTTEMLKLISCLSKYFSDIYFIMAATDKMSSIKSQSFVKNTETQVIFL